MHPVDHFLKWATAATCGYEAVAIFGQAISKNFPLPTITYVTHSQRHSRATYMVAGGVVGLLLHHLLVEGLESMGATNGVA